LSEALYIIDELLLFFSLDFDVGNVMIFDNTLLDRVLEVFGFS